ncbi:MAG TPA: HNH endonuclease signature motif containing protein, partial [Candidatus Solibacter sp.]|nr:HNH endonuclease signature motif containing protein [Candidatus Solibacter sp.]
MQIHHIEPEADGGSGDFENGIPVCLDCHAEIESHSNMGRRFTAAELKEHRNRWFTIVRDRPEVLIRAAHSQAETGPLEALLAELEFNRIAVSDGTPDEDFPVLATEQFRRAIATNALAALAPSVRESVHRVYGLVVRVNYHFEEMARMDRSGGSGGAWAAAR